jgi:hypothetical protein
MPKQIDCDCGTTVRGMHDEDLVAKAQDHYQEVHPDEEPKDRKELLAMARDAD